MLNLSKRGDGLLAKEHARHCRATQSGKYLQSNPDIPLSQTVGKRTSSVITGSTYIFTAITRPSDVRMAQIVRLVQYQEVTLNGIYAHSYG